jgi:hypothetical protein
MSSPIVSTSIIVIEESNSYLKVAMQTFIKNFVASANLLQLVGLKVVDANREYRIQFSSFRVMIPK